MIAHDIMHTRDVDNEPMEHFFTRNVRPSLYFYFDEDIIDGNRVVVLTIPAARTVPTEYKSERYIRIGSSKESVKNTPKEKQRFSGFCIMARRVCLILHRGLRISHLNSFFCTMR